MNHEQYIGQSVKGHYELRWDLEHSSQIFSFDFMPVETFDECYPTGLLAAKVSVERLDLLLPTLHRPPLVELWSKGDKYKILGLLSHIHQNKAVSPPFIAISPYPTDDWKLAIQGGTHRYSIAKDLGQEVVPVHLDPSQKIEYEKYLELEYLEV